MRHCLDCGTRLNSSDGHGPNAPVRCTACNGPAHKVWTREAIIAAVQRWADEHGLVPPTSGDWNSTLARKAGRPERGTEYPSVHTVQDEFGSWSEAIRAAGFDAFAPSHYGREGEDPEVVAKTVELYRSGLSAAQVGERMGICSATVIYRLRKAGEPRRSSSEWRRAA